MFAPISADVPATWAPMLSDWRHDLPAVIAGRDPHRAPLEPRTPSGERVIRTVTAVTCVSPWQIRGDSRIKPVMRARQAVYLLMQRACGYSPTRAGRALGDRDHTTVLAGMKRAEYLLKTDAEFAALYRACEARLEGFGG